MSPTRLRTRSMRAQQLPIHADRAHACVHPLKVEFRRAEQHRPLATMRVPRYDTVEPCRYADQAMWLVITVEQLDDAGHTGADIDA